MNKLLVTLSICATAICAGAYTWWNLTRISFENHPNAYMIKTMVPVYESLPMTAVDNYESVRAALAKCQISGPIPSGVDDRLDLPLTARLENGQERIFRSSIAPDQIESLLDQAAELVYFRLINEDPAQYINIRGTRSAVAPTEEELLAKGWGELDPMFQYYIGRPAEPGDTMNDLVIETFNRWRTETGIGRVASIADKGDGSVCSIGLIDATHDTSADLLSTALGIEGWAGSAPATGGTFLFPKGTIQQQLKDYGALPYAKLGLVIDYSDAPPQAVVFEFYWNPEIDDWQFTAALFINRKNQDGTTLPHF